MQLTSGGVRLTETELIVPGMVLPLRSIEAIHIRSHSEPNPLRYMATLIIVACCLGASAAAVMYTSPHADYRRNGILIFMLSATLGLVAFGWMLALRPRMYFTVDAHAGPHCASIVTDNPASAQRWMADIRAAVASSGRPLTQIAMVNNLHQHGRREIS